MRMRENMYNDNCQKIKLLKLMELLRQETDENHPITTSEICRRLGEMGISCERRTVGKDMKVLREQTPKSVCLSKLSYEHQVKHLDTFQFTYPPHTPIKTKISTRHRRHWKPGKNSAFPCWIWLKEWASNSTY